MRELLTNDLGSVIDKVSSADMKETAWTCYTFIWIKAAQNVYYRVHIHYMSTYLFTIVSVFEPAT